MYHLIFAVYQRPDGHQTTVPHRPRPRYTIPTYKNEKNETKIPDHQISCFIFSDSVSLLFLLFYAKSMAPSFTHFFNNTRPSKSNSDKETEPVVTARISSGAHDLATRLAKALPPNVLHLNLPVSSVVQDSSTAVCCVTAMNGQSFMVKVF